MSRARMSGLKARSIIEARIRHLCILPDARDACVEQGIRVLRVAALQGNRGVDVPRGRWRIRDRRWEKLAVFVHLEFG